MQRGHQSMQAPFLRLLGSAQLVISDQQSQSLSSRKGLALLAYLVCTGDAIPRSRLTDLLWPDLSEQRGRRNLSRELSQLAALLPSCFAADYSTIAWQPMANLRIDIQDVATLLKSAHMPGPGIPARNDSEQVVLVQAIALYRGEFLSGLFLDDCAEYENWLVRERECWHQQIIQALERLIAIATLVPLRVLLEALYSLQRRSLIEQSSAGFNLQNVVLEYLTELLITTVCEELLQMRPGNWRYMHSHTLMQSQTIEYVRQSQVRLIVQPIIRYLAANTHDRLASLLHTVLGNLRTEAFARPGYAGGDIFNLLVQANLPLQGMDFSGLTLWQGRCTRNAAEQCKLCTSRSAEYCFQRYPA